MNNEILLKDIISRTKSEKEYNMETEMSRVKREYPVYIFGAGSGAERIAKSMINYGISVEGFFESKYYYTGYREKLGKPVIPYDEANLPQNKRSIVFAATGKSIFQYIEMEKKLGNEVFSFDNTDPLFEMKYSWVHDHVKELQETMDLFEDTQSKETFLAFIDNKAHCIDADIRPLWQLWNSDQYFNELYDVNSFPTHALVDCGAWIGDTAEEFISFLKGKKCSGMVYSFEPDPENYLELERVSQKYGNIFCYNCAVGDENKDVIFSSGVSSQSHISADENGITVKMVRGDDILKGKDVSLIKMDLEGGEKNALLGMTEVIRENTPMLAVCVYHKIDDMIVIPNCIKNIIDGVEIKYKYYLRHHSSTKFDTVLYAVPIK